MYIGMVKKFNLNKYRMFVSGWDNTSLFSMLYSVLFLLPVRKGGTILNGVSIQERGLTQRVYDNFTTYFSNGKTVIPPQKLHGCFESKCVYLHWYWYVFLHSCDVILYWHEAWAHQILDRKWNIQYQKLGNV